MIVLQAPIILAVLATLYWAAKPLSTNHAETDEATSRDSFTDGGTND